MTADQIHANRQPGKTCLQKGAGLSSRPTSGRGRHGGCRCDSPETVGSDRSGMHGGETVSCSSSGTKSAAPGSDETPQKPEFTQVTSSMFVDRSAVPNSAAMEFAAPSISSDTPGSHPPVDPPECAPLYWGPDSTQMGSVSWSTNNEGKVFALFLSVPAERPDFRSLLGKCGTIEYQGDTFTVSPLGGVPGAV